jgi:hypothetical protein
MNIVHCLKDIRMVQFGIGVISAGDIDRRRNDPIYRVIF